MSRIIFLSVFILASFVSAFGQTKEFSGESDKQKVFKGDTIIITVDTAFVINKARAAKLNYQLNELQQVKAMYNNLVNDHAELVSEIRKAQQYLNKLAAKLEKDGAIAVNNLDLILVDLDNTLNELKNNNNELNSTNTELNKQIISLQKSVKALKNETKWIWWNGATDKLFAIAGGIGIGILIGILI